MDIEGNYLGTPSYTLRKVHLRAGIAMVANHTGRMHHQTNLEPAKIRRPPLWSAINGNSLHITVLVSLARRAPTARDPFSPQSNFTLSTHSFTGIGRRVLRGLARFVRPAMTSGAFAGTPRQSYRASIDGL